MSFTPEQINLITRTVDAARKHGETVVFQPRLTPEQACTLMLVMDEYSTPEDDRAVWEQVMDKLWRITA
jgi:hypothetical protein